MNKISSLVGEFLRISLKLKIVRKMVLFFGEGEGWGLSKKGSPHLRCEASNKNNYTFNLFLAGFGFFFFYNGFAAHFMRGGGTCLFGFFLYCRSQALAEIDCFFSF